MKILILGLGRSGTTSLMKGLNSSINNSTCLFEIFNKNSPDYIHQNYINHLNFLNTDILKFKKEPLIEKNLIGDIHGYIENKTNYQLLYKSTDSLFYFTTIFYINYLKSFNKTILISRRNLKESSLSWANCLYYSNFFQPYKFNPDLDIEDILYRFEFEQKIIEEISNQTNIPITYYEDIYTGNKQDVQNFLKQNNIQVDNFEILFEHLHPKNRLRQN
jgi:hypothetical protein